MIYIEIDKLIIKAMKGHDEIRTRSLRAIKAAFLNWKTSKENIGKELDDAVEIQILKKLVKQRQESADMYAQAGRNELALHELEKIGVIKEFLPAEVTCEQITEAFHEITQEIEPVKKNMGLIIKNIKAKYPSADGKMVATLVGSLLN